MTHSTATTSTASGSIDAGPSDVPSDPDDGGESADAGDPPEPLAIHVEPGVAGAVALDLAWLKGALRAALDEVERSTGRAVTRIALRLVDDRGMAALHERYRGAPTSTDVLAFDASAAGEPIEADVAVCVDEAARRGAELGHSTERELLLYALHGLLHCAGFDDHGDEHFARMHAEEDRILEAIGVGATFRGERS